MQHFLPERFWCFKQINIFRDLTEPDADALAQLTTFKRLKTAEPLCAEGVYLIKEGRVKIYETPPDAEENVTREVLEPGELFGAVAWDANAAHPNVTAETLTAAVIGMVTVRNFLFFLKRKPHLAMPIRRTLSGFIPAKFSAQSNFVKNFLYSLQSVRKTLGTPSSPRVFQNINSGNQKQNAMKNPFGNIVFRCPASRLAHLIQNLAELPTPNRTTSQTHTAKITPKLSIKALAQLIGSSEEKTEELLNQFKQHKMLKRRYRRIQILDPWQLKKIANAKMKTLPAQDDGKGPDELSL